MSKFSGLSVRNVRRIVRHAIINHYFFQEIEPGIITHSALTAVLAEDEVTRNSLIVELDEFWPAGVKVWYLSIEYPVVAVLMHTCRWQTLWRGGPTRRRVMRQYAISSPFLFRTIANISGVFSRQ